MTSGLNQLRVYVSHPGSLFPSHWDYKVQCFEDVSVSRWKNSESQFMKVTKEIDRQMKFRRKMQCSLLHRQDKGTETFLSLFK